MSLEERVIVALARLEDGELSTFELADIHVLIEDLWAEIKRTRKHLQER